MPRLRIEVNSENFNDVLSMSMVLSEWIRETGIECMIENVPTIPVLYVEFSGPEGEQDLVAFRLKFNL